MNLQRLIILIKLRNRACYIYVYILLLVVDKVFLKLLTNVNASPQCKYFCDFLCVFKHLLTGLLTKSIPNDAKTLPPFGGKCPKIIPELSTK